MAGLSICTNVIVYSICTRSRMHTSVFAQTRPRCHVHKAPDVLSVCLTLHIIYCLECFIYAYIRATYSDCMHCLLLCMHNTLCVWLADSGGSQIMFALLFSMVNLGITHRNQHRFSEAALLLEEALPLYKTLLGPEHPHTLECARHLARTYRKLHRKAEADQLKRDYSLTPV
jgi:hypothetical protein